MARSGKEYKRQKDTLIAIALEVFIQNGYEQTSMAQLRKAFNLSVGGMYHYFSSKEEILDAIIQYGFQQGADDLHKKLASVPIEKRLYSLISDSAVNDFALKLFHYSESHRNSLVAYKLREQNVYMMIPLVAEIFRESVRAGLYKTELPDEFAEFIMLLAKAVIEANFLPERDAEGRMKRVDALLLIFKAILHAPEEHIDGLRAAFRAAVQSQVNAREGTM